MGKTSFKSRFLWDEFKESQEPTMGASRHMTSRSIANISLNIELWVFLLLFLLLLLLFFFFLLFLFFFSFFLLVGSFRTILCYEWILVMMITSMIWCNHFINNYFERTLEILRGTTVSCQSIWKDVRVLLLFMISFFSFTSFF